MVNHGVSRACKTCKKRRKKCDEIHPICQRCRKANRACLGYEDDVDLIFRHHRMSSKDQSPQSLKPLSTSVNLPESLILRPFESVPKNASDVLTITPSTLYHTSVQHEGHALKAFLHDYCLVPDNYLFSRGYLNGLETLLAHAEPSSDLSQATMIVALANFGLKFGRDATMYKARILYYELLRSLRVTLFNEGITSTAESLMTVVLLGLYEIITATEDQPSNHSSHSHGVFAILSTQKSPFDLLSQAKYFQISNALLIKEPLKMAGVLCAPILHHFVQSLDALVLKSQPLFETSGALLSSSLPLVDDLRKMLQEARSLNGEFAKWPANQPGVWRLTTIGFLSFREKSAEGLGWLSGRVDDYLNLYVAAVWTMYRKARIVILDIIIRCSKRLEERNSCHAEEEQVEELTHDMMASLPFHLSRNLDAFMKKAESGSALEIEPGRSIGGLFLMHPLFVSSNLSVVPRQMQMKMRECLAWIGRYLGIGQAILLSKSAATFPNESVGNGYALIWAGMLFTKIGEE